MPHPVNLPKGFDPKDKAFKKFSNKIPTRENCDLTEPKEMFLWMLVALPGVNGGHQVMPSSYNMLVSQHMYECGAMLQCPECGHVKDPLKHWVAPSSGDPHWLTSPGRWKRGAASEEQTDAMDEVLDQMTQQQRAALFERLKRRLQPGQQW